MLNSYVLGIDVSKDTLDAALLPAEKPTEANKKEKAKKIKVKNTPDGFRELIEWLNVRKMDNLHICLEATGTYGDAVARFFHDNNYKTSVVNPLLTRRHAESEGLRGKNDPMDAASIARFCREKSPREWVPPTPELSLMKSLLRHLGHLVGARKRIVTASKTPGLADIEILSFSAELDFYDKQISFITSHIKEHVASHPSIEKTVKLLETIPGIAELTAWKLIAEIGDRVDICTPRQIAAYAGLTPEDNQSGTSVNGKPSLSKKGNSRLRCALFYPAIAAMRHNPIIKSFSQRLLKKGKTAKSVVCASMHKLLKIAVAIMKSGEPFNANISAN